MIKPIPLLSTIILFLASLIIIVSPLRPVITSVPPELKTNQQWLTYKNDQYGFEFQYPANQGFDPNYNVEQTKLSYSDVILKMKPNIKSETKISINNTNYNLFTGQAGDLGDFTYIYFSYFEQNYIIVFGQFPNDSINRILTSIKFFAPTKYTCPTTEWIGCMPGPDVVKPQCQADYLDWVKLNCPNFKGVAL